MYQWADQGIQQQVGPANVEVINSNKKGLYEKTYNPLFF